VPRKRLPNLTDAELRLMDVLWRKGRATVAEAAEALPKDLGLAYNTVLTTMRILEKKGYLRHSKAKEGRAFIYRPAVGRAVATRNAVRHLLARFFGNSPAALALNLLNDKTLSKSEAQRIRDLLKREEGESQ
jgi:predicted transcriptional regulator